MKRIEVSSISVKSISISGLKDRGLDLFELYFFEVPHCIELDFILVGFFSYYSN